MIRSNCSQLGGDANIRFAGPNIATLIWRCQNANMFDGREQVVAFRPVNLNQSSLVVIAGHDKTRAHIRFSTDEMLFKPGRLKPIQIRGNGDLTIPRRNDIGSRFIKRKHQYLYSNWVMSPSVSARKPSRSVSRPSTSSIRIFPRFAPGPKWRSKNVCCARCGAS